MTLPTRSQPEPATENWAPDETSSRATRARIDRWIERTPVRRWRPSSFAGSVPAAAEVWLKLELFQRTGSYKVRGALNNTLSASPGSLAAGVTAVSAGNHAVAAACAAREAEVSAKVVMLASANPLRVRRCRALGAEIVFAPDAAEAFRIVRQIEADEGRLYLHPYEGVGTILGASTVGLEIAEQMPWLDALVIPVGGGGLLAGTAAVLKQMCPWVTIYGVEPVGADSMRRSLEAGRPTAIEAVRTIADSLGAPYAEPIGFSLARRFVDEIVLVEDDEMRRAMRFLFEDAKLVTEPASAAPFAALCGPLRDRLAGKQAGLLLSGANIDLATFREHIEAAPDP